MESAPKPMTKLEMLQKQSETVRMGGKGSMRRKVKRAPRPAAGDEKKIQSTLKQCGASVIPNIDSLELFKDDGSVISFKQPKVNANLNANMLAVSGKAENKSLAEFLMSLSANRGGKPSADDLPELLSNFEAAAKASAAAAAAAPAPAAEEKKEVSA